MKLIKIDKENYINPEKVVCIHLSPTPINSQYWLTVLLEDRAKFDLQFNTLEEGEQWIKELVRITKAGKAGE